MSFQLNQIVPWGRSYREYVAMFDLNANDLNRRILACADGPASFNSVLTQNCGNIISIDPLYQLNSTEIRQRIAETYPQILAQLTANQADFIWTHIPSVAALGEVRMAAMNEFLIDYEIGKTQRRYLADELPKLSFVDQQFDLALCSHFLFLYAQQLSLDFHIKAIEEMLRVATEVRLFPLQNLEAELSPHIAPVIEFFTQAGFQTHIKTVAYEFQRAANQMLVIRAC
jgi:hypothetical protein